MSGIIHHPTRVGYDPLGRKLAKVIGGGVRSGKIRKLNANTLWTILFGVPVGYVRDWLDGYNPEPPSKVAPVLADASWRAIRAD